MLVKISVTHLSHTVRWWTAEDTEIRVVPDRELTCHSKTTV